MVSIKPVKMVMNYMISHQLPNEDLISLALNIGVTAEELRNDIDGQININSLKTVAKNAKVSIPTIMAIYSYNYLSDESTVQTAEMADYVAYYGYKALIFVPQCGSKNAGDIRHDKLRNSLTELFPLLSKFSLMEYVELLGLTRSSLRLKSEAVQAINELELDLKFELVHDTFHNVSASEKQVYSEETGLIYFSDFEFQQLIIAEMIDAHRVMVGPENHLNSVFQISELLFYGTDVNFSFEPISESVHQEKDKVSILNKSIEFIKQNLNFV